MAQAVEIARAHGAAQTGVVHLLYVLARTGPAADALVARGARIPALRRATADAIVGGSGIRRELPPPLSLELERTLQLAAHSPPVHGGSASIEAVLDVLLSGAVADPSVDLLRRHGARRALSEPLPAPPPRRAEPAPNAAPPAPAADVRAIGVLQQRIDALELLLHQQEMPPWRPPNGALAAHDLLERARSLEQTLARAHDEHGALTEQIRALERALERAIVQAPAPHRTDALVCTVRAPHAVVPGGLVRVEAVVDLGRMLEEPPAPSRWSIGAAAGYSMSPAADRGAIGVKVAVTLESADATIRDTTQLVLWHGQSVTVTFLALSPELPAGRQLRFRLVVRLGQRPLGVAPFAVVVAGDAAAVAGGRQELAMRPYRQTYIACTSEDRPAVIAHLRRYPQLASGILADILDLDPEERAARQLWRRIDDADLFLLVWSRHAARSSALVREAEHALARQQSSGRGTPAIFPFLLDGPPPAPRPASLQAIDFDRALQFILAAELDERGERIEV